MKEKIIKSYEIAKNTLELLHEVIKIPCKIIKEKIQDVIRH